MFLHEILGDRLFLISIGDFWFILVTSVILYGLKRMCHLLYHKIFHEVRYFALHAYIYSLIKFMVMNCIKKSWRKKE